MAVYILIKILANYNLRPWCLFHCCKCNGQSDVVHENLAIYSHNPEVRYIEFLMMDSGSELSPEQDPVVWKILNFGHLALNSAN